MIPYVGQVKINRIDKEGMEVESQLCKTFIPIDKVFQTEISLPVDNYDKLAKELFAKNAKENFALIFPLIMDQLKETLVREFLDTDSQLNAVVAFQIKTQLKKEGYTVGDKSGEKTPSLKQLMNHLDKKGKSGKIEKTQEEKE